MRRNESPLDGAKRVYPDHKPLRTAFILGARVAFAGGLPCDCPYEIGAPGSREAWHKGFVWARGVNSVLIGASA